MASSGLKKINKNALNRMIWPVNSKRNRKMAHEVIEMFYKLYGMFSHPQLAILVKKTWIIMSR